MPSSKLIKDFDLREFTIKLPLEGAKAGDTKCARSLLSYLKSYLEEGKVIKSNLVVCKIDRGLVYYIIEALKLVENGEEADTAFKLKRRGRKLDYFKKLNKEEPIQEAFQQLRKVGKPALEAIMIVAEKFNISDESARSIIYPRKSKNKS
ncbi:MAG: hypothetical protein EB060_04230 [Proteobacteria bacterium]|nr:hypothetical protein [Pseudomonadota bacterium]